MNQVYPSRFARAGHLIGPTLLSLLLTMLATIALLAPGRLIAAESAAAEVTVFKSRACGCCGNWVDHLQSHGFHVKVVDQEDINAKKDELGVPRPLRSCHTAEVGGYIIEGHVPAADIIRLLGEQPAVKGLTVPGMPHGSPGMETGRVDSYEVLTFDEQGDSTVFNQYGP